MTVRMRRLCRVAVVCAAVAGLSGVGLVDADGVQTEKFGLAATGARSKIVHPVDSLPVRDSVVVTNRTAGPLTVDLAVVGVTKKDSGGYDLGAAGSGLAAHMRLDRSSVRLSPHGQQLVAVTIEDTDNPDATRYAAVTATEATAPSSGVGLSERLAVLVEVDATGNAAGRSVSHTARKVAVVVASVLLLAILAALIAGLMLRRRRT